MFEVHETKEHKKMFISQMEDDHLQNTIKYHLRKIEEAKAALASGVAVDAFKGALYGVKPETIRDKAIMRVHVYSKILYPYLAEASLRGINMTVDLQRVYGRDKAEEGTIPIGSNSSTTRRLLQLQNSEFEISPEFDDDYDEEWGDRE